MTQEVLTGSHEAAAHDSIRHSARRNSVDTITRETPLLAALNSVLTFLNRIILAVSSIALVAACGVVAVPARLSGLATGMSWLCYYRALQLGNASQVAPVDKLSVALSVLLAVIFLHEKLTLKAGLGVVLILAGTLVMVW